MINICYDIGDYRRSINNNINYIILKNNIYEDYKGEIDYNTPDDIGIITIDYNDYTLINNPDLLIIRKVKN